jgi:hypothetical protein
VQTVRRDGECELWGERMREEGNMRPFVRGARGVTDSSWYSGQSAKNMAYWVDKKTKDDMWGILRDTPPSS